MLKNSMKGWVPVPLLASILIEKGLGSDEYCPHCDNHFVLEAKTPKPTLKIEGEDVRVDARMLKDDRLPADRERSIFDVKDAADKLG
ncbi:MAG: hypothetical protein M1813_003591 [Trichoglossum hirsutum]|nr:MAG: hypothetical protein M1813_003591 [Trichoglossum hirsutum]